MTLEPVRSLWIGDALPAAQAACVASFLRVGHPFELFVYDRVANIPDGVRLRPASEIVPQDRVFTYSAASGRASGGLGGFSNLFRYTLLAREGGCWVDTDNFCLKPLPQGEVLISSERLRDGVIVPNCGVVRCPPEHALARYCLERCEQADTQTLAFGQTGPALIAAAVQELGLQPFITPPEAFCSVDWFEFESLLSPGEIDPNAVGIHLWGEMWRRRSREILWPGPEGSLLAQLAATLDRATPPAPLSLRAPMHACGGPNQNATR